MWTIPNLLSLSRIPLALLFFKQDLFYRILTLTLAMISDGLDGFLARRYQQSSRIGTLLDPMTDRFFVFVVIGVLLSENQLHLWQACTMLCRDFAVILFGFYLVLTGKLTTYQFRAIWCGKVTTFLQFIAFFAITLQYTFSPYYYGVFIFLGVLALIELYLNKENQKNPYTS
jgi:CDP-diacylglycerol--glycerol-3-phosphate 3-phosphatidyltransferase